MPVQIGQRLFLHAKLHDFGNQRGRGQGPLTDIYGKSDRGVVKVPQYAKRRGRELSIPDTYPVGHPRAAGKIGGRGVPEELERK